MKFKSIVFIVVYNKIASTTKNLCMNLQYYCLDYTEGEQVDLCSLYWDEQIYDKHQGKVKFIKQKLCILPCLTKFHEKIQLCFLNTERTEEIF